MTRQEAINTVYGLQPGQAVVIRDHHGRIDVAQMRPAHKASANHLDVDGSDTGGKRSAGDRALLSKSTVTLHWARIAGDGSLIGDVLSDVMPLADAISAAEAMKNTAAV